jgi:hypothetical protein
MTVERFDVLERGYGMPKGLPIYDIPRDQAVWMLGRVALDGLWPKDIPLHLLILAPRAEWGTTPASYSLYVASRTDLRGFAWRYRRQEVYGERGVRPWLHTRREAAYLDVPRPWLPIGAFPADLAGDVVRLELPGVPADKRGESGPFDGHLHVFLEAAYVAAGWGTPSSEQGVPVDLRAGSVATLPARLFCPANPIWGTRPFGPRKEWA